MKFTLGGGAVVLRLEEKEASLLLSVADTGRGIHPEDQPHVFDRFFQTNRPEAPAEGGTGIGLALVSEFARLMAGKVWLESKLDEGSVFFFEWPKKKVQEQQSPNVSPVVEEEHLVSFPVSFSREKSNVVKPLILLVEDNPDMRDYIRLVLEDRYELAMAENGEEALKFLTGNGASPCEPSLIVSDLMMPVMDGFQLVEALKSDPRYHQIPIIILTARADVRDKLRALRTGVDDYLLKPFEEEELQVRIENLLQRYQARTAFIAAMVEEATPNEPSDPDDFNLQLSGFDKELTHGEAGWLEKLEALVRQEVQNDLLSVDWLAAELYISERQLRRRLKSLTGLSPSQYIREVRLQEPPLLEDRQAATPADAAWAVSFRDPKHFSQLFRERFGKLPSSYIL
ncbi:MAG: response regulator [Saprospirales bacterium]|nr:response regulator [Saprospirales bacterium]